MSSRLVMIVIAACVALAALGVSAQSAEGRVTAWNLNVRSAPEVTPDNVIGQLQSGAVVSIEGRSLANDWLYIRSADGGLAGWASTNYIQYDAAALATVPVVSADAVPLVGEPGVPAPTPNFTVPEASETLIMETPLLHNMTSAAVYDIFRRGQRAGNNPRVFMKVGDSVTATQPFLVGFGEGTYNLGPYADLQPTIDFFNVSPGRSISSSFTRTSLSAVNGFVSGAVFDGTWSPEYCGQLVPLDCEYDIMRPAVAIVLFGGQDVRLFDAAFFQQNMRRIADSLRDLGVIPVFTTFPMHESYRPEQTILYNTIVITTADDFDIPVINLYRALQDLPDGGAKYDDVVHLTQGETYYQFTGEEALYGVTLRNLLTLQALDVLRREVLDR
ncbi:MAG: SH3 domain-containing protein [bacterium]|nr:SH3 domain-containing protein [bacterium]